MRRLIRLERRIVAVVGILAIALAFLPGLAGALGAANVSGCCTGVMCPMHHTAGDHMSCGMDMSHSSTSCEACPCHPVQYTAELIFVRATPPVLGVERLAGVAPVLQLIELRNLAPEIDSPPPRFLLS